MTIQRCFAAICCLLWASAPALAQTYAAPTFAGGSIGNVAANGAAQTIFRVSASTGGVTVTSGSAVRLSTGAGNVTVTVACGNQAGCTTDTPKVTIATTGTPTGRAAALQTFTAASGSAAVSAVSGTNPLTFTLTSIGRSSSKTFLLGFDFPINTTGSTGSATSGFSVTVTRATGSTTGQGVASSNATASVFRGIAIAKSTDLAFGKIVRPSSGSGTVSLSAAGTISVSGTGTAALASPAPTVAAFSVTGEGGQAVTVTVPSSFAMTSGANSLTVTTAASGSGVQTLSGTIGGAGSLAVNVGGSFPLTSVTATGLYSGTFTVSVAYN